MPVMVGFMEQDGLLYNTRFLKDPEFADAFAGNWSRCGPVSLLGREEEEEKGERARQLTDRLAASPDERDCVDREEFDRRSQHLGMKWKVVGGFSPVV